jgi:hypothetical protein
MDHIAHEAAKDHETYINVAPDENKEKDLGNQSSDAAAKLGDVESFQSKQPESAKESNAEEEGSRNTVTQDGQSSDDTTRIGSNGAERPASAAEDSPKGNGPPALGTIEGAIGRAEEKEGGEQGQAKGEIEIPERKTKKVTVMEGDPETLGAPRGGRYAQPGLSGQLANGLDLREEVYRDVHVSETIPDLPASCSYVEGRFRTCEVWVTTLQGMQLVVATRDENGRRRAEISEKCCKKKEFRRRGDKIHMQKPLRRVAKLWEGRARIDMLYKPIHPVPLVVVS